MFAKITIHDMRRPLALRAAARKRVGPYTWTPSEPGKGRGFYQSRGGLSMDRAGSSFALRLDWANDILTAEGHRRLAGVTGYYCDSDGAGFPDSSKGTLQPIIARLPHGRGYLSGWTMGEGMAACLDPYIHPEALDAAHAAHSLAAYDAEQAVEASALEMEAEG